MQWPARGGWSGLRDSHVFFVANVPKKTAACCFAHSRRSHGVTHLPNVRAECARALQRAGGRDLAPEAMRGPGEKAEPPTRMDVWLGYAKARRRRRGRAERAALLGLMSPPRRPSTFSSCPWVRTGAPALGRALDVGPRRLRVLAAAARASLSAPSHRLLSVVLFDSVIVIGMTTEPRPSLAQLLGPV